MTLYVADSFNDINSFQKDFFFRKRKNNLKNCHCLKLKSFIWRKIICYKFDHIPMNMD